MLRDRLDDLNSLEALDTPRLLAYFDFAGESLNCWLQLWRMKSHNTAAITFRHKILDFHYGLLDEIERHKIL